MREDSITIRAKKFSRRVRRLRSSSATRIFRKVAFVMPVHRTGSCLCRSVSYEVTGDLDAIDACHCSMCAKTSGNYAAMARCASADVKILNDETLRWSLFRYERARVLRALRRQSLLAQRRRQRDLCHCRNARSAHGAQDQGAHLCHLEVRLLRHHRWTAAERRVVKSALEFGVTRRPAPSGRLPGGESEGAILSGTPYRTARFRSSQPSRGKSKPFRACTVRPIERCG